MFEILEGEITFEADGKTFAVAAGEAAACSHVGPYLRRGPT